MKQHKDMNSVRFVFEFPPYPPQETIIDLMILHRSRLKTSYCKIRSGIAGQKIVKELMVH